MLTSAFIGAVNHLLVDSPWARQRLAVHADGRAVLAVGSADFTFSIDEDGYLCESAGGGEADVCIALPAPGLAELSEGFEGLFRSARINGQVEMADALGFVFRNLRWDLEGDLARILGDAAAHRACSTARSLVGSQKSALGGMARNLRAPLWLAV